MSKQIVVCSWNGKLLSNNKEWTTNIENKMNFPKVINIKLSFHFYENIEQAKVTLQWWQNSINACLSTSCEIYQKKQEETFYYDGTSLVHVLVGFVYDQKPLSYTHGTCTFVLY
jgi:hypothetical protein